MFQAVRATLLWHNERRLKQSRAFRALVLHSALAQSSADQARQLTTLQTNIIRMQRALSVQSSF
jgi:hypothetical protein